MELYSSSAGGEAKMMQEFVDQINKTARSATDDMHTALPGEIKSYDPGKGVATVLPKAKFTKPDGSTMDFPEISGVPVMFPQSKNVTIAWPIKAGDGCLLVFSEQALDYWMYGKETDTKLKFDLTNAIAIPNLTSGGNGTMKLACDEDAVAIAAGDTTVKITPSTVQAEVGGTVLTVSPDGVTIEGKLTVKGGIVARDDVKASNGSISLANHTHKGDSGGMTGKPQ
jgi:phage baseplate assembly protein gpV